MMVFLQYVATVLKQGIDEVCLGTSSKGVYWQPKGAWPCELK